MIFGTLDDVENFYKCYAHETGFSVRVSQKKKNEETLLKRYYCSREGFRKESAQIVSAESGKKRKSPNVMETRCGCEAHEFMVDEQGRLVRVFWADALCRKNYSVFGDVILVDATYTTNHYNMKFVPFIGS